MNAINGTTWAATHYEIVVGITSRLFNGGSVPNKRQKDQGIGCLYELAEKLTNEFEQLHARKEWDEEWFDAIEAFLEEKLD